MSEKRFNRQCPSCHGTGGEIDVICDGQGPFEQCGFCNGEGEIKNKKKFYIALGYASWEARRIKEERLYLKAVAAYEDREE